MPCSWRYSPTEVWARRSSTARPTLALLAAVLLALQVWCPPAAADDWHPRLDLWPLVRYWRAEGGAGRHLEVLWPLVEWHDTPASSELYLRPLYNRRGDKPSGTATSEWLYPLGSGRFRRDYLSRRVLYPLALRDRETEPDGKVVSRTVLLPLLYYRSGAGPTDLLLFPFGGVLHNLLGREKVVVVLWPLFVWQRGAEATSWSVLHPIFTRVRWDGGGWGFKVWPLFGLNRRRGRFLKLFVLWPVVHYQRMETSGNCKFEISNLKSVRWWVFPLVGRITEPGGSEWSVLWPFFGHRREGGREEWWLPWPVVGRRSGDRGSGWMVWPLYGNRRTNESRNSKFETRNSFLWPLGWYGRREDGRGKSVSVRLVPLMFWEREEAGQGAAVRRTGAWQVWPLAKWRRTGNGETHLEFPSVMPLRWHGGWERNFAPFFRVFEYHRTEDGVRSWRLLWRLARVESRPEGRRVEVFPLFRLDQQRGEGFSWSLMKGLAGCEQTERGRRWRLLYLIRLGGSEEGETTE